MGWTESFTMGGHKTPKAYLDDKYTWENDACTTVVLRSTIRNNVYYGALQQVSKSDGRSSVFAVITPFRHRPKARDGYIFGWKDMEESALPYQTDCPNAILDLLSETSSKDALTWRQNCRERNKTMSEQRRKPKPKPGMIITFKEPIRFTDGREDAVFKVVGVYGGLRFKSTTTHGLYKIRNLPKREYTLSVPAPEHATL